MRISLEEIIAATRKTHPKASDREIAHVLVAALGDDMAASVPSKDDRAYALRFAIDILNAGARPLRPHQATTAPMGICDVFDVAEAVLIYLETGRTGISADEIEIKQFS